MDMYPEYFKSSMKNNLSTSPAIMESIDSPSLILTVNQQSNYRKDTDSSSVVAHYECSTLDVSNVNQLEKKDNGPKCFMLINDKEQLKVMNYIFY